MKFLLIAFLINASASSILQRRNSPSAGDEEEWNQNNEVDQGANDQPAVAALPMNQPHNRLNNPENPFESPVRNNIQIHQNQFETPPPDNNQDGQNLLPPLLNQNNRYNPDLFETPRRGNIPLFGNNLDVPNLQGSPPVPNGLNQRPSQRLFGVRRLRNRPHRDNAENDRPEVIAPEIFRQFGRNDDTSARIVTPPSVPRAINFLELPLSHSSSGSSPRSPRTPRSPGSR